MPEGKPGHPETESEPCRWCGDRHGVRCPWVRAIEYDPTTYVVTRVEFLTPADCGPPARQEGDADRPGYPTLGVHSKPGGS